MTCVFSFIFLLFDLLNPFTLTVVWRLTASSSLIPPGTIDEDNRANVGGDGDGSLENSQFGLLRPSFLHLAFTRTVLGPLLAGRLHTPPSDKPKILIE